MLFVFDTLAVVVDTPVGGVACNFTELDGVDFGTEPEGKRDIGLEEGRKERVEQEADAHGDGEEFLVDRLFQQLRFFGFKVDKGRFCLQVNLGAPIGTLEVCCIDRCGQKQE